jgi:arylsulfatase A-like enzyme
LVAGTVFLLCGLVGAAAEVEQGSVERPNIVFILADDLGYGDLGSYGQRNITTPNLDRVAAEGMRFTQFYAGSTVCAPSRCVLMTGRHVGHATVRANGDLPLRDDDVTMAEVLKQAGYATGVVGKWGLGQVSNGSDPLRQGFDSFYGYLHHLHAHNYYPSHLWRDRRKEPLENVVPGETEHGAGIASRKVQYSHDMLIAEALRFVERHKHEPFFLYLPLTIPHVNNEAKDRGMEVPDLGDYAARDWPAPQKAHAAMISRMDADIGRLLALLANLGIDGRTIVFFSSDNGPHGGGGVEPEFNDSNGPLRGMKRDLYEGGIRVPLLVRWPGRVPAGSTSDHVGFFGDILPTAAELAGAPAPAGLDGISLVPELTGRSERQRQHEFLYWEFHEGAGGAQALRQGDWKAVRKPAFTGPLELYDLATDVGESRDVAAEQPAQCARMEAIMRREHASPRAQQP